MSAPGEATSPGVVIVEDSDAGPFAEIVRSGVHVLRADEPVANGGNDTGPGPYDYLLAALGSCTAMTLRMYATRKTWPLEDIVVRLREAQSHAADCANCETQAVGIRRIEREIELRGAITEEQRERLLQIADRCPIKQTLERGVVIESAA